MWIVFALWYMVIAGFVAILVSHADDPHDHFSAGDQWSRAIVMGVLWPLMLVLMAVEIVFGIFFD